MKTEAEKKAFVDGFNLATSLLRTRHDLDYIEQLSHRLQGAWKPTLAEDISDLGALAWFRDLIEAGVIETPK